MCHCLRKTCTEGGFFCLLQQDLLVSTHISTSPCSPSAHFSSWVEKQIVGLKSSASTSKCADRTKGGKWSFGRTFHQNGAFVCVPVLPIKGSYTNKYCGIGHTNGSLNCSGIQMEIDVPKPGLYQRTHSQTSFSAVKHQRICKTAHAGTSMGISCFGPFSPLRLAVWSPLGSQTGDFMSQSECMKYLSLQSVACMKQ